MRYLSVSYEMDERYGLDEWPTDVMVTHKTRPNVGRKYIPMKLCEVDSSLLLDSCNPPFWEHELSCGHAVRTSCEEPPRFCEECGAEVMRP